MAGGTTGASVRAASSEPIISARAFSSRLAPKAGRVNDADTAAIKKMLLVMVFICSPQGDKAGRHFGPDVRMDNKDDFCEPGFALSQTWPGFSHVWPSMAAQARPPGDDPVPPSKAQDYRICRRRGSLPLKGGGLGW